MGAHIKNAFHRPNCLLCGVLETIHHVMSSYTFHALAADIVVKASGHVWDSEAKCDMQIVLIHEPLLSMKST